MESMLVELPFRLVQLLSFLFVAGVVVMAEPRKRGRSRKEKDAPRSRGRPKGSRTRVQVKDINYTLLITDVLVKGICDLIVKGNFPPSAAILHGVSSQSYYRWMRQGARLLARLQECDGRLDELKAKKMEDSPIWYEWIGERQKLMLSQDQPYLSFFLAVTKAIAQADDRDISKIDEIAQRGEWKAAAWKYNRRHQNEQVPVSKIDVVHRGQVVVGGSVSVQGTVEHEHTIRLADLDLPPEVLKVVLEAREKKERELLSRTSTVPAATGQNFPEGYLDIVQNAGNTVELEQKLLEHKNEEEE